MCHNATVVSTLNVICQNDNQFTKVKINVFSSKLPFASLHLKNKMPKADNKKIGHYQLSTFEYHYLKKHRAKACQKVPCNALH